ncbi:hypothetical protein BH11ACT8_BH11ACT8_34930 [soil metagenome]
MPPLPRALLSASLVSAVALAATGCGNAVDAEVIGSAGVTVDSDRRLVVLVEVCRDDVDSVSLVTGREGLEDDEPNPTVASWTAATPQSGSIVLETAAPPAAWTGPATVALDDGTLYVVSASSSERDAEVTQASFRAGDLASLSGGDVIVRDGSVMARAAFEAGACDGG